MGYPAGFSKQYIYNNYSKLAIRGSFWRDYGGNMNKIIISQCLECRDITAIPNPNTGQGIVCCGYNCDTRKLDNVNKIPDWCPRLTAIDKQNNGV